MGIVKALLGYGANISDMLYSVMIVIIMWLVEKYSIVFCLSEGLY